MTSYIVTGFPLPQLLCISAEMNRFRDDCLSKQKFIVSLCGAVVPMNCLLCRTVVAYISGMSVSHHLSTHRSTTLLFQELFQHTMIPADSFTKKCYANRRTVAACGGRYRTMIVARTYDFLYPKPHNAVNNVIFFLWICVPAPCFPFPLSAQ